MKKKKIKVKISNDYDYPFYTMDSAWGKEKIISLELYKRYKKAVREFDRVMNKIGKIYNYEPKKRGRPKKPVKLKATGGTFNITERKFESEEV